MSATAALLRRVQEMLNEFELLDHACEGEEDVGNCGTCYGITVKDELNHGIDEMLRSPEDPTDVDEETIARASGLVGCTSLTGAWCRHLVCLASWDKELWETAVRDAEVAEEG